MRVATWNMQGASAYGENSFLLLNSILNGENIDVMCLQECGCLSERQSCRHNQRRILQ